MIQWDKKRSISSPRPGQPAWQMAPILVNPCQKGNPLLEDISKVTWKFGLDNMLCDYEVGHRTGVFYLSMRYHSRFPNYIYDRVKAAGQKYKLLVVLLVVDQEHRHERVVRELTSFSVSGNFTLLLAWSNDEAARYLESFKTMEGKSANSIKPKVGSLHADHVASVLTTIRSVNRSDAATLVDSFGSLSAVLLAKPGQLKQCPGLGPQKVSQISSVVSTCFDPVRFKGNS